MNPKEKIIFYFCFTFISFSISFAQADGWEILESGTNATLKDVFFINADTGWVAGFSIIMNTTDGGENWTVQDNSNKEFWSIYFTDKDHGWAVGYKNSGLHGFIYHTSNGGQSWNIQDSSQYYLHDIFFANADIGYAVGGGGSNTAILRTTNAGADWEEFDEYGRILYTVHFINDTVGWAAGEKGYILKTEDGGNSWNKTYIDIGINGFWDIHFVNQDTGWVAGGDSIFKTTNGGDSWESLEGLSNHSYICCYFINSNVGWVGGHANEMAEIIYTEDGGDSWQVQYSIANSSITSLFFIDDNTGWAAGSPGTILKTSSGGIVSVDDDGHFQNRLPDQYRLRQNYPNPFNSVTTISYHLPVTSHVSLVVYNLQGEEVITLVDRIQSAGKYDLIFDGSGLAEGIYYYKLADERQISVKKMLLIKK
jgi:photosystem II stability/assembly factor-like uncharacterized protein